MQGGEIQNNCEKLKNTVAVSVAKTLGNNLVKTTSKLSYDNSTHPIKVLKIFCVLQSLPILTIDQADLMIFYFEKNYGVQNNFEG